MRRHKCLAILCVLIASGVIGAGFFLAPAGAEPAKKPDAAAIERTRREVRMLDDLYKNFVVNITATYVDEKTDTAAGRAVKKVFRAMDEKGWHSARLVDATGKPINKGNLPKNAFEKMAIKHLKKGKTYYEEIGARDGKPVLRAATVVPVVMKKCLICHPGYQEGDLLGAIVYEVPIK